MRKLCGIGRPEAVCSDLILNTQFRLFGSTNPIALFLYRSVISYKTDEKPIFSLETVAGSGKW